MSLSKKIRLKASGDPREAVYKAMGVSYDRQELSFMVYPEEMGMVAIIKFFSYGPILTQWVPE